MSWHNDKCKVCGFDFGPMGMLNCLECNSTYCNECYAFGHDCEEDNDE